MTPLDSKLIWIGTLCIIARNSSLSKRTPPALLPNSDHVVLPGTLFWARDTGYIALSYDTRLFCYDDRNTYNQTFQQERTL